MALRTLLLALVLSMMSCAIAGTAGPYRAITSAELAKLDSLMTAEGWTFDNGTEKGENGRVVASGLSLLLGPFGAHRLYLGTTPKVAIIYGVTFGGFGVLALLDLGHLLFSKDLDRYRNNDRVFMWGHKGPPITPP